jgi:hypothetical protein
MKTGERLKVLRGSGGFFSKNPPEKNKTVTINFYKRTTTKHS